MTYMPFPFEIIQTPKVIVFSYEFAHARRHVFTDGSPHPAGFPDFWMGDSRGRWEGDTLVVDVTNLDERTWLDHAGNFHSDALHVVERYTPIDASHLYEATLGSKSVLAALEDQHAALSPHRQERQDPGYLCLLPPGQKV